MLITWDPGLSVGHQKLDSDHRRFIGILNSLHEAVTVGNGRCVIGEILCDLAEYARGHFSDEEYLMQRSQYNGYIEHRQEHLKFVNELSLLIRDFEFRRTDVAEQTLAFLSQWLIKHRGF